MHVVNSFMHMRKQIIVKVKKERCQYVIHIFLCIERKRENTFSVIRNLKNNIEYLFFAIQVILKIKNTYKFDNS